MLHPKLAACAASLLPALSGLAIPVAHAETETWNAHAQATTLWQLKPSVPAAYSGAASLQPGRETVASNG